jgi:hypothetical protein
METARTAQIQAIAIDNMFRFIMRSFHPGRIFVVMSMLSTFV